LVLQGKPHELRLILAQSGSKLDRSLQAHRTPFVLNIAQVRSRDPQAFGKLGETFTVAFPDGS
jgi:hypothetical protein